MHILVTSPIPTHPLNHGNRARLNAFCRALKTRGHVIHFVYGGFEGITQDQELAMRAAWDHVHIIPAIPGRRRRQSHPDHHLIDDWYDDRLDPVVEGILTRWEIGACIANYVWFARWLTRVPADIPTFIDTHDIFAGRHALLTAAGIEKSWFSTTATEEAKGLNRARTVIAIQQQEADSFRSRIDSEVVTIGHLTDPRDRAIRTPQPSAPLRVGLMASDNPVNAHMLTELQAAWQRTPHMDTHCTLVIAGSAGRLLSDESSAEILGYVEDAETFFSRLDLLIAPNIGGSGLKIKTVEALASGLPVVATSHAMIGLQANHDAHTCPDLDALCAMLVALSRNSTEIHALKTAGQNSIQSYHAAQEQAFDRLFPPVGVQGETQA